MSEKALRGYKAVNDAQRDLRWARNIRGEIESARGTPHEAGIRWPFELLQNALDAGPRAGRDRVEIHLRQNEGRFTFKHDGAAFSFEELSALVSGGSSKEFDSAETTGRFGTGFLVTHVLATRTRVAGLLDTTDALESFSLVLERSGDEAAIVANMAACTDAIGAAAPVDAAAAAATPSAEFEYVTGDADALKVGLAAFRASVPYLFGTCPRLGRVVFEQEDHVVEAWDGAPATSTVRDGTQFDERVLHRIRGDERVAFRVLRATPPGGRAAAVVVLEPEDGARWRVAVPARDFPRVFRSYPMALSSFFPVDVILDGVFDVDKSRRWITLKDDDEKARFVESLEAAAAVIGLARDEDWTGWHALARAAPSPSSFSMPEDVSQTEWLTNALRTFAHQLARMPFIETRRGRGAALADDSEGAWHVDFLNPRLSDGDPNEVTTAERMWPLVDDNEKRDPPTAELAETWSRIAEGWHALGVTVSRITLEIVARDVRDGVTAVDELHVRGDKREWLARFLQVVGECWDKQGAKPALLDGLLPDQTGRLSALDGLKRDAGISVAMKDIGDLLGVGVRRRLLDQGIVEAAERLGLPRVSAVLHKAVPVSLTEDEVIAECLLRLEKELPEERPAPDSAAGMAAVEASIRLLAHLAKRGQPAVTAFRVPLVARNGTIVRATHQRRMMAPVTAWQEPARLFYEVYPPDRVLGEIYRGDGVDASVVPALVDWGIAHGDPLSRDVPAELRDDRLRFLAVKPEDAVGAFVVREEFTQIALLHPELFNRCDRPEHARALFGLVLAYVAPNDPSWRSARTVTGRKEGAPTSIEVREALWLSDLRWRAWVPVPGEEGKSSRVVASAEALKTLLDPNWLRDNGAALDLLGEFFGFDALELRLLGAAPEDDLRQGLRNRIAQIVEVAGSDPRRYEQLLGHLQATAKRESLVKKCREMGLAVQTAIGDALSALNLSVKVVDHGFDFQVESVEDAADDIGVGRFFVEVKATTTGDAKLTPTQAEFASTRSDRFVLCVVDLRAVPADRLERPWTAADVLPLAHMVVEVGGRVQGTWELVHEACGSEVALRNEKALRYAVPPAVWEGGRSIGEWVEATFKGEAAEAAQS